MKTRCDWVPKEDKVYQDYHDYEWGVPAFSDKKQFEFLILESAQAGLSWATILKKRLGYKKAFANFSPIKVSKFTDKQVEELLNNPAIIRNRAKISAAINNAKAFLKIQKEFGSFSKYIWEFVNNIPIKNSFKNLKDLPAKTELSEKISSDLKARGFKFLGPTTIYSHMQAVGMVNDHLINCFRYSEIKKLKFKLKN